MKRTCDWCGASIITARSDARYCSSQHRIYGHRAAKKNPIPRAMLERTRWIRHNASKVPLTVTGTAASSTDPTTWATHAEVVTSSAGVGLGYVLGDGIGCIDLDHCISNGTLDDEAEYFIANYPGNYIEVSPSGDGLHIWGLMAEQPGTKRTFNGLSIERYSTGRYITITGNVYQHGHLLPL